MRAARHFVESEVSPVLSQVESVEVELYGSLALTGRGHGTDRAVLCGLEGESPDSVTSALFEQSLTRIDQQGGVKLLGTKFLKASQKDLVRFLDTSLPLHPNGMIFIAKGAGGCELKRSTYYSVGGGFIVDELGAPIPAANLTAAPLPNPFQNATELLKLCDTQSKSISEIILANECAIQPLAQVQTRLKKIWATMDACIESGLHTEGILPGGLKVSRRASQMYLGLKGQNLRTVLTELDYLSAYALAVNEENAAFGRVVTAPTNGAAGIIPAVFKFYLCHMQGKEEKIEDYLLTASAVACLFKAGASLSAAEMGCQGEIGVAASMAAAALTAVQGGTPSQVENAAEIAIEHSLGLTCDPIGGLVQIPCIERNAIGAVKALTSSQLALKSDGKHIVSLDQAIAAMKKTGEDMHSKYKETAKGGLAVSVAAPEC